jgi:hypothetical protein
MNMRCTVLLCLLLLAGCETFKGPRARRDEPPQLDPRCLTIAEQEQRARDRLAYPDRDPAVGPAIDGGQPGMNGR